MSLEAFGADAVRKLRFGPVLDVLLDLRPRILLVADPLAIRADRKQPFELLDARLQPEDALRHPKPRLEGGAIDRLGDEIVGSRLHALQVASLPAERGEHDDP